MTQTAAVPVPTLMSLEAWVSSPALSVTHEVSSIAMYDAPSAKVRCMYV